MTHTKKIVALFTGLVFLLSACERIVELEIPSGESKLVIEGQITSQNEPWSVNLSLSQAYFDQSEMIFVTDAVVTITGSDGTNVILSHTDSGHYESSTAYFCTPGVRYTLSVDYKGKKYTASEEAPLAYPIDTIASYYLPDNNGFIEKGYYVFIQGKEREEQGDYYLFKAYRNDTLKDDFGVYIDSDEFGSVSYLNEKFDINNIAAELSLGKTQRPFPFTVLPNDTIKIEQYAITREYYQYIVDLEAQIGRSGTPFDPPPANPNNNISNGGLGYFSVSHKEVAELIVKK